MSEEAVSLAVVALIGLAYGLWLGLPGRDRQTPEDIDRAMEKGGSTRRRTKRIFTPMAWLQRKVDARPSRGRGSRRRGFKLESPDDRD